MLGILISWRKQSQILMTNIKALQLVKYRQYRPYLLPIVGARFLFIMHAFGSCLRYRLIISLCWGILSSPHRHMSLIIKREMESWPSSWPDFSNALQDIVDDGDYHVRRWISAAILSAYIASRRLSSYKCYDDFLIFMKLFLKCAII